MNPFGRRTNHASQQLLIERAQPETAKRTIRGKMDEEFARLEFSTGEQVVLTATCSIGRTPDNRLVIPFDAVSRRHATLQLGADGGWTLVDMGSSNGTLLDRQPVSHPVPLRDGSVIEIGPQKMTFRVGSAAAPTPVLEKGDTVACWLLSLAATLMGARQLSEEAEAKTFESWSTRCQRIVKKFRGATMRATDESFLGFWPEQGAGGRAATVVTALRSLRAVQMTSEEFRFALHFGSAVYSTGQTGEGQVEGPAVIHAIQLDRLARTFGCAVLITEAASLALGDALPLRPLGVSEMRGYRGAMRFFTLNE